MSPCAHAQPEPEDRQADEPGDQCGDRENAGLPVGDDLEGIEDEKYNPQGGQHNGFVKVLGVKEKGQDHAARVGQCRRDTACTAYDGPQP